MMAAVSGPAVRPSGLLSTAVLMMRSALKIEGDCMLAWCTVADQGAVLRRG
jgi:hypothetical protein